MFRCENKGCHKNVERHQPVNRIIVETRERTYVNWRKKGRRDEMKIETHGEEIVEEISVCPECYFNITGLQPARSAQPMAPVPKRRHRRRMSEEQRTWRNPKRPNRKNKDEPVKKKPVVEKVERLKGQKNERA